MLSGSSQSLGFGNATSGGELPQQAKSQAPIRYGLSFKLLLLTIVFVMLAEVLIFVPSVASFRASWLMERLAAAQIVSLAVLVTPNNAASNKATPNNTVPKRLGEQLLQKAMVHGIAIRREGARLLVLEAKTPKMVAAHYNLENASMLTLIRDVWDTFGAPSDRLIRVSGKPDLSDDVVEIVMTERLLKLALCRYSVKILGLSFLISLISAALVYLALNYMFVRPIARLTRNIMEFRDNPEDTRSILTPSGRRDEIGVAQTELASMQNELVGLLRQKSRLAALGLAVSKINHDLRNMLSTAQLMSDGISASRDPIVQRWTPKLISSLDRAITLCMETLRYGRAEEAAPQHQHFALRPLIDEVGEGLGLPGHGRIRWTVDFDETTDLELNADRNQMYRVLTNLVRNAVQILETPPDILRPEIRVAAHPRNGGVVISVSDNGPGVPEKARAHLFEAFQGSARVGGTGLGLAISAELVRAHGGRIWLDPDVPNTTFHIFLPAQGSEKAENSSQRLNNIAIPLAFGRPKH